MNTKDLINSLSNDLSPVPRIWPFWNVLAVWLISSIFYVGVMILLFGPLRPGVEAQLAFPSRFSFEMLFGVAAMFCWATAAFADSVPGLYPRWPIRLGWMFLGIWLLHFIVGIVSPSLEPSMLGKREHCASEAYIYSLPPTLLMIWLQQRRYPLIPLRAAVYAAVAAATIPALAMQVACMYEPTHILANHVLPILILATCVGIAVFPITHYFRK